MFCDAFTSGADTAIKITRIFNNALLKLVSKITQTQCF